MATGRFASRDPFRGLAPIPQTLNPYPYVLGNPVLYDGPSGLICLKPKCIKEVIRDVIGTSLDATYILRSPTTRRLETAFLAGSEGQIEYEGGIRFVRGCTGLCELIFDITGEKAFTLGHTIFFRDSVTTDVLEKHEIACHSVRSIRRWFLPIYFGNQLTAVAVCGMKGQQTSICQENVNLFEKQAGPQR